MLVSHYKVLVKSGWKYRISAVIDVFPNDVYSAGSPTKESGFISI